MPGEQGVHRVLAPKLLRTGPSWRGDLDAPGRQVSVDPTEQMEASYPPCTSSTRSVTSPFGRPRSTASPQSASSLKFAAIAFSDRERPALYRLRLRTLTGPTANPVSRLTCRCSGGSSGRKTATPHIRRKACADGQRSQAFGTSPNEVEREVPEPARVVGVKRIGTTPNPRGSPVKVESTTGASLQSAK